MYATWPAFSPAPASVGPTCPFLPPAPWQLAQFAEKTAAPADALPAATFMLVNFDKGIGRFFAAIFDEIDILFEDILFEDILFELDIAPPDDDIVDCDEDEVPWFFELQEATAKPATSITMSSSNNFFTSPISSKSVDAGPLPGFRPESCPRFTYGCKSQCPQQYKEADERKQGTVTDRKIAARRADPIHQKAAHDRRCYLRRGCPYIPNRHERTSSARRQQYARQRPVN
jgi:hypothetical protein